MSRKRGIKTSLDILEEGAKASQKMESVRLEIEGHMSSVGEQIVLCVLEKQQQQQHNDDVVCVLRVVVTERLRAAAEFMFSLFQRELDTLLLYTAAAGATGGGILETKKKEIKKRTNGKKKTASTEEFHDEQKERRSSSLAPEEKPQRLKTQIKERRPRVVGGGSTSPDEKSAVGYDENRETEPVAGSSAEQHETAQADGVRGRGTPDRVLFSSVSSESDLDDGDGDDWAETREGQSALNSLKSDGTRGAGGDDDETNTTTTTATTPARSHQNNNDNDNKSFACQFCGKRFSGKSDLKRHIMIHTGEKPFTCAVCDKSFVRTHHLKRHAATHQGDRSRRRSSARSRRHTEDPESPSSAPRSRRPAPVKQTFPCSYCGKTFNHKKRLKRHEAIHTGEENPCPEPKKQPAPPARSSPAAAGKRSFLCSFCGKMFSQKSDLERHTMVHTGEKPCKCPVCGKGFIRMLHLKIHKLVHTGEKPISCTVCGKGFIRMHHLKRHVMIHTGERSFNCRICGKDFSRKDYVKTHMKTHAVGENVDASALV